MTEMPSVLAPEILEKIPDVAEAVEVVFGCKWSLRILALIRRGICRPGAILQRRGFANERELAGLTTKVQNYYFRRMINLGILEKTIYPAVTPHVEYHLTDFGQRFVPILDSIEQLQIELEAEQKN